MPKLSAIAKEIDRRAEFRPIGRLQELRKELNGLGRIPDHRIFSWRKKIDEDGYSFHLGGRTELQFNIGLEYLSGKEMFRQGVGFCLDTNQTLPEIDILVPKIERFNEYLVCNPDEFVDLLMWHYDEEGERSRNTPPEPIPPKLVRPNVTIFLGRLQPPARIDFELVLDDLDRLLPLYEFVQGTDAYPTASEPQGEFQFKPGCSIKLSATKASLAERKLDVKLRHNDLQLALHDYLASLYGADEVGTERPSGTGYKIDLVVRQKNEYWFYEIKIAMSARACIREGLAQLLDYSFGPGGQEATRLVIVGEPVLDKESRAFLALLKKRFSLPLAYQQFDLTTGKLLDPEQ